MPVKTVSIYTRLDKDNADAVEEVVQLSITSDEDNEQIYTWGPTPVVIDVNQQLKDCLQSPAPLTYDMDNDGECPAGQSCIYKNVNGGGDEIIATNITNLQLSYIDDGGNVVANPADPSQIRAIQVTITGATSRAASMIGSTDNADFTVVSARTRQLSSIVRIRNR